MPSSPTTAELIAELSGLLERATPGPWVRLIGSALVITEAGYAIAECETVGEAGYDPRQMKHYKANAALIVAAVNALPTILSRLASVEALERQVATLRSALEPFARVGALYPKGDDDRHMGYDLRTGDYRRAREARRATDPTEPEQGT